MNAFESNGWIKSVVNSGDIFPTRSWNNFSIVSNGLLEAIEAKGVELSREYNRLLSERSTCLTSEIEEFSDDNKLKSLYRELAELNQRVQMLESIEDSEAETIEAMSRIIETLESSEKSQADVIASQDEHIAALGSLCRQYESIVSDIQSENSSLRERLKETELLSELEISTIKAELSAVIAALE